LQTIRSGVPEFVAVDDKLLTPARAREALVALLSENGVAQTVSVAVDKNRLTLQGSLDAEKETALRSLLSEWRDNTGNKIDLVFSLNSQARPSTQKASAPAAPQASIQPVGLFLGDNPYVVLQGRKRLLKVMIGMALR